MEKSETCCCLEGGSAPWQAKGNLFPLPKIKDLGKIIVMSPNTPC